MRFVIGMLRVNPDEVEESGSYIVRLPEYAKVLCVGWVEDHMTFWVSVPVGLPGEPPETCLKRFWILPGNRQVDIHQSAVYLGTVISRDADGSAVHDWHVFGDGSGDEVRGEAQATYSGALH